MKLFDVLSFLSNMNIDTVLKKWKPWYSNKHNIYLFLLNIWTIKINENLFFFNYIWSHISNNIHENRFHNRIFGSRLFCYKWRPTPSTLFQKETPHPIIGAHRFDIWNFMVTLSHLLFGGRSSNQIQLSSLSCGNYCVINS